MTTRQSVRAMARAVGGVAVLAASLGCAGTHASAGPPPIPAAVPGGVLVPPTVPPDLAVPTGAKLVAHFHATGAQVYVCAAAPPGGDAAFAWTLKRPDATLIDESGRVVGSHGAGPTWTSKDGSAVVGKKVAQSGSPDAAAVPWLLLRAESTSGAGVFTSVTYVQRVATANGEAPTSGCDETTVAKETPVAYTAEYYFYRGGEP